MDEFNRYRSAFVENIKECENYYPLCFVRMEQTFREIHSSISNPKSLQELMMFFTTHSAFRVAMMVIYGGAYQNSAPVIRQGHEAALYAFLFRMDKRYIDHWKNKDSNKKSNRIMRNDARRDALKKLRLTNAKLYDRVKNTYDNLNKYGAHPNAMSAEIASETIKKSDGDGKYLYKFLGGQTYREVYVAMLVEAGLDSLQLYKYVFPETSERVTIDERCQAIQQDLITLYRSTHSSLTKPKARSARPPS